ncbi:MAG TPA: ImmA/IrrE family metallo-endopeptidase [Pyrinomonadaceae bacterium]|jgi:Zn-dependent peptidase ImmA (M78 family)
MIQFIAKKAFTDWNERVLTERDIRRVAKKKGVQIVEGDVGVPGLYIVYGGVPFIVVHPDLTPAMRLWVLFHELAHHLFHVPGLQLFDSRYETKADYQANVIAAVALIPLTLMQRLTYGEIQEEYGYPKELMDFRLQVYEDYGF